MAQTEHLPIYKSAYDLCPYIEQVVHGFSHYHKYTLGADLRHGARRALKLVVRANAQRETTPVLLELREVLNSRHVCSRWFWQHATAKAGDLPESSITDIRGADAP